MTRWPLQPLLDAGHTRTQITRALGLSGTGWHRLEQLGLSDKQADRAAIRLGAFPHEIWPDWFTAALGPLDHDYLAGGWRQAWLYQEAS